MKEEFTEDELHTITIGLLTDIRLEQQLNKAYLESLANVLLSKEQKDDFIKLFKSKRKKYLQQLSEQNPILFGKDALEIIESLEDGLGNTDADKKS